jgi:hypothetical protein
VNDRAKTASRLREVAALLDQAATAVERGDLDEAARLERQALAERQSRHKRRSWSVEESAPRRIGAEPSLRELLVQGLTELDWPVPVALLTSYMSGRFGIRVDSRQLASHRRDEARSYARGTSGRSAWLVPALDGRRFVAMRGKLALSAWPLEKRLIGPWSERADQLRVTATLAEREAWLARRDPERGRLLRPLITRLAGSVPGATGPNDGFDAEHIATACRGELELIARQDMETRVAAAERAGAQLNEDQLLWGAELPRALAGGAT